MSNIGVINNYTKYFHLNVLKYFHRNILKYFQPNIKIFSSQYLPAGQHEEEDEQRQPGHSPGGGEDGQGVESGALSLVEIHQDCALIG